ncbi:MAG: protein kinase [Planctomycetes bacterium]|nr:protein kinase [Planctomycetota bacterium]
MRVDLVVAGESGGERVFALEGRDAFLVGRSSKAHLPIKNDPGLSRNHCVIELAPPRVVLRDLGSRNGTLLNGRRVDEAPLRPGDVIRVGNTTLRVRFPDAPTEDETEAAGGGTSTYVLGTADGAIDSHLTTTPPGTTTRPGDPAPEIPGFRILGRLGEGSQGMVWLAHRERTGEEVALKLLLPAKERNPKAAAMFLREMEVHGRLDHPRIVRFLEGGTHRHFVYLAMEYVPGVDAERLRKESGGQLPVPVACRIAVQALEGLAHAHVKDFVHRDVKPSNILVAGSGREVEAKLNDFGIAKALGEAGSISLSDEIKGSIPFMPPDQILHCKKPLPQFDVYSMGATLYRLLAGKYLYDFDSGRHRLAIILEDPPIPIGEWRSDVPRELERVIEIAVAKDLLERYPDARFFLKALAPFAG